MNTFDTMCIDNWSVTLGTFGVTATLTDASGEEYAVDGVISARNDVEALDTSWLERATQAEFFCQLPTGFVITPSACFATVGGVTFCVMDAPVLDGGNAKMLLERRDLEAIEHRGRRY